jgi:hypothetical protein
LNLRTIIENEVIGYSFATDITIISIWDLKTLIKKRHLKIWQKIRVETTKKRCLQADYSKKSFRYSRFNKLEIKSDHVYMHLVESAPFNKGKTKVYAGVPGNLVAFACKLAFQCHRDGKVCFFSKTQLAEHYVDTLGTIHFGG